MATNKKGASGSGTIRKRSDGRWEARYSLGFDPKTGKQIQKSIYAKTQKEVRQRLNQIIVQIDEDSYSEPSKMTVKEWMEIWLNDYMGDKKYSTAKAYKATYNTNIAPHIGHQLLTELNPHMMQKYFNELHHGSDTIKAHAPKTVRNIHGVLCKALNQAVINNILRENPIKNITLPRKTRRDITPLTDVQIAQFIKIAEDDDYCAILKTILFTGMRESEAIGLTWDCVDFDDGTIRIYRQLQKRPIADGGFTFESLKNGKQRLIKPARSVMDLLMTQKKEQSALKRMAGTAWNDFVTETGEKGELVFTNPFGRNFCPQTVYNHLKSLGRKIGADRVTVHDLRHTYVVLSIQNGDDIKTIQDNVGHATAAFTLDVYGHVSEKMKSDSATRMEAYMCSISNTSTV